MPGRAFGVFVTTQSDQSLLYSLAHEESSGFTCRLASVALGSPPWHWGKDQNPLALVTITTLSHYGVQMPLEVGAFGAFQVVPVVLVQGRSN